MINSITYQEHIIVQEEDLDELHHVNNVVYLKWVQYAAGRHWSSSAPVALQQEVVWVVVSHFIQYKKPAFLGDQILLETYVEKFEGVKSHRRVNIYKDGTLLATALTEWCMLDKHTMRPKRISSDLEKIYFH